MALQPMSAKQWSAFALVILCVGTAAAAAAPEWNGAPCNAECQACRRRPNIDSCVGGAAPLVPTPEQRQRDAEAGIELYRRACSAGSNIACYRAHELMPRSQAAERLSLVRQACESGLREACVAEGVVLAGLELDSSPIDVALGQRLLSENCAAGNAPACVAEADLLRGGSYGALRPDPAAAYAKYSAVCGNDALMKQVLAPAPSRPAAPPRRASEVLELEHRGRQRHALQAALAEACSEAGSMSAAGQGTALDTEQAGLAYARACAVLPESTACEEARRLGAAVPPAGMPSASTPVAVDPPPSCVGRWVAVSRVGTNSAEVRLTVAAHANNAGECGTVESRFSPHDVARWALRSCAYATNAFDAEGASVDQPLEPLRVSVRCDDRGATIRIKPTHRPDAVSEVRLTRVPAP